MDKVTMEIELPEDTVLAPAHMLLFAYRGSDRSTVPDRVLVRMRASMSFDETHPLIADFTPAVRLQILNLFRQAINMAEQNIIQGGGQ